MGRTDLAMTGREHWVPDAGVAKCSMCSAAFGMLTRKHHCRVCGDIFCAWCSNEEIPYTPNARSGETGHKETLERVCKDCFQDYQSSEKAGAAGAGPAYGGDAASAIMHGPSLVMLAFVGELIKSFKADEGGDDDGKSPRPDGIRALPMVRRDSTASTGAGVLPLLRRDSTAATGQGALPSVGSDSAVEAEEALPEEPLSARSCSTATGGAPSDGSMSARSAGDAAGVAARTCGWSAAGEGTGGGEAPQPGDIVVLGPGVLPRFRRRPAVVIEVAEGCCTAMVLDKSRRFGTGVCRVSLGDVMPESRLLRPGTRVRVAGLTGKAQKLNGLTGTVTSHPRAGHPCVDRSKAAPDQWRLLAYVHFDSPSAAVGASTLVEPRFLAPCP